MSRIHGHPEGAATAERKESPEITGPEQDASPETAPAQPLPPGLEGFQVLGDEAAGYCADGACALPDAPQPGPDEG